MILHASQFFALYGHYIPSRYLNALWCVTMAGKMMVKRFSPSGSINYTTQ
jgi:hypothetical protein